MSQGGQGHDPWVQIRVATQQHAQQVATQVAQQVAQGAVGDAYRQLREVQEQLKQFSAVLTNLSTSRAGANPSLQYVENIPGRRLQFDYLVDIPIPANFTGVLQGTITISQEGPFVATARYATLLSQSVFRYTNPETTVSSDFQARSYGRYRPVHSAWDIMDGTLRSQVSQAAAFPGDGSAHIISPSNASSFRTMQGDFRIKCEDAGSNWPRSNIEVPSSLWVKQLNDPQPLAALDVFERGTVITFKILPQHVANPAFGNVSGYGTGGNWPFLGSQWDAVEGINDPEIVNITADPVTRVNDSILTIGFQGYRIIQPAGIGSY